MLKQAVESQIAGAIIEVQDTAGYDEPCHAS